MKQKANKQQVRPRKNGLQALVRRLTTTMGFKKNEDKEKQAKEAAAFGFLHTIEEERRAYNEGKVKEFRPFRKKEQPKLPLIEETEVLNPSTIIDAQLRRYNNRKTRKPPRRSVDLVSGLIYVSGIILAAAIIKMLSVWPSQDLVKPFKPATDDNFPEHFNEPKTIEVRDTGTAPAKSDNDAASSATVDTVATSGIKLSLDRRGHLYYGESIGPILQAVNTNELRLPRLQKLPATDTLTLDLKVREWQVLRTNDADTQVRLPVIGDNIKAYAAVYNILWDCNPVNLDTLRATRENLLQTALDASNNNNSNNPAYKELKIYLSENNKNNEQSVTGNDSATPSTTTLAGAADATAQGLNAGNGAAVSGTDGTSGDNKDSNNSEANAPDASGDEGASALAGAADGTSGSDIAVEQSNTSTAGNGNLTQMQIDRAKYRPDKAIYITYDFPTGVLANAEKVLNTLQLYNAQASFFISGDFLSQRPNLVLRMNNENHVIGSLGWTLEDAARIAARNEKTFLKNLNKLDENFKLLVGRPMDSFFRPPEGSFSQHVLWLIRNAGYYPTFWGLELHEFWPDSKNTLNYRFDILRGRNYDIEKYPYTLEQALNLIKQELHPGLILRLDGRSKIEVDLLEPLLKYLTEKGYTCLNLNDIPLDLIGKQEQGS